MNSRAFFALPFLYLFVVPPCFAESALTCDVLPTLMDSYLSKHIQFREIDSDLEERVSEAFIRRLDPGHSLFTRGEIKEIEGSLSDILPQVREGHCTRLLEIHQRLTNRYRNLEKFAKSTLNEPEFVLDESLSLQLDPDERDHPKNDKERLAFQRKFIQFEVSNEVANNDSELGEAKKRIIHRYELATKRVMEREVDEIYAAFLNVFAAALDPHSNYFSKDDLDDFKIQMGLELEGIGAALSSKNGYTTVEKIITGGAAYRHKGLKLKDKIIAIGQGNEPSVDAIDMSLRDVVRLIRGKKGTVVRLEVMRQGEKTERLSFHIVRDTINLEEQAASVRYEEQLVNGNPYKIAILDLPTFYGDRSSSSKRQCWKDVEKLLREVKKENADGLVLDLSKNGGGLLEAAVLITGFFIQRGGVVAVEDSTRALDVLPDRDPRTLYSGPMVVLISKASASASEILAGALKDYQRALIVGGDHTFGKGTIQSVLPLPPGLGAVKVTTGVFFRPGGRSTQQNGVVADIRLPSIFDTGDFGEEFQPNSLPGRKIDSFISRDANSPFQRQQWTPVTSVDVNQLESRSKKRVASNDDFQDLLERLKKVEENKGVVKLEEILNKAKDTDEPEHASTEAPDSEEEEKNSPQLDEAVNILGDYVYLLKHGSLENAIADSGVKNE